MDKLNDALQKKNLGAFYTPALYTDIKNLKLNGLGKNLLRQWDTVLKYAKKAKNYDPALTYGIYQIAKELDTFHENEKTGEKVWDYKELHAARETLKTLVKTYYNEEIVPTLFEYEFLK